MKWEYKQAAVKQDELTDALNAEGRKYWEAFSINPTGERDIVLVFYKRPAIVEMA